MARYRDEEASRPKFGRIDPFCWVAVVPILLVAVAVGLLGGLWVAVALVCVAGLLVLFDSWVNRGAPPKEARRDAGRRVAPSRTGRRSPPPRRRVRR